MNKREKTVKKEYKYKAFISYRHLELAKPVAIELQKQLEAFQIPEELRKNHKEKRKRLGVGRIQTIVYFWM